MVVVVADVEALEILGVLGAQPIDQRFRRHALLFGQQHGGRAVRIVGADIDALVATHALKTHPDVRLDVLEQMAEMNGPVGVGQGAGDKDAAHGSGQR